MEGGGSSSSWTWPEPGEGGWGSREEEEPGRRPVPVPGGCSSSSCSHGGQFLSSWGPVPRPSSPAWGGGGLRMNLHPGAAPHMLQGGTLPSRHSDVQTTRPRPQTGPGSGPAPPASWTGAVSPPPASHRSETSVTGSPLECVLCIVHNSSLMSLFSYLK